METNLKAKSVSLLLVTIMLCSIFTGAVTADVNEDATDNTTLALSDPSPNTGNTGYEPWYYYTGGGIVNSANGNLYLAEKDSSIKARGFDIEIIRAYNSHNSGKYGPFGFGWTFNYNLYLVKNKDGSVTFFDEDGSAHTFSPAGGNNYTAPPGIHSELTKNPDGSFTLWFTNGSKYNFGSNGRINNITDKNANHLNFEYSLLGRLTRISDDSGLYLNLNYNMHGRISSVSDPLGREIKYEYEVANLVKVTDAMGDSSLYQYYDNHKLKSHIDRVGSTLYFSYYSKGGRFDRVKYIKSFFYDKSKNSYRHLKRLYLFEYDDQNRIVVITNDKGYTTSIQINEFGNPIKITDPFGNIETKTWDSEMNLMSFTDANGHTYTYEYDAYGNLIKETNPLGYSTLYEWSNIDSDIAYISLLSETRNAREFITKQSYDTKGNLIRITDATGNSSHNSFNNFGYVTNLTDYRGYSTLYSYNTQGYLINITDACGNVTRYEYDAVGRLVNTTNANGYITTIVYDDNDRAIKEIDALGGETVYNYNEEGTFINTTYPKGEKFGFGVRKSPPTTTTYDALGRVISITDALGNTESYTYDAIGNRLSYTDINGHTTTYEYDALNRLVRVTDSVGRTTNYTYDANGNEISYTDVNGHTTTYEYDALDRLIKEKGGDRWHTTNYDANGNIIADRDSEGNTITYEYDALNRLTKIIDPTGNYSLQTYDAVGNVLSTRDKNGNIVDSYTYDALDRVTQITDALGNTKSFTYDEIGNLIKETDFNGNAVTFVPVSNRQAQIIDSLGNTETFTYDEFGNLISRTDANGKTTTYTYDDLGRLIRTTNAFGHANIYEYDAFGNLISVTDANGHITRFEYDDDIGGLTKVISPLGYETRYQYDKFGNLIKRTDANGYSTTYGSDEFNKRILISYPDGSAVSFKYDDNTGNIINAGYKNANVTFKYDILGRRVEENWTSHGWYVKYSYDAVGNIIKMQDYPGDVTTYEYDSKNRLISITDPSDGITRFGYDAVGNRISLTYPNDVEASYSYDELDRLVNLVKKKGANIISNYTYEYDGVGNRIRVDEGDSVTTYKYDDVYRLIEAKKTGAENWNRYYSHDAVGNRIELTIKGAETTYFYDADDSLVSSTDVNGTTFYGYDANGNVIYKTSGGQRTNYSYDFENRLTKIEFPDSTTNEYNYGVFGERIKKKDRNTNIIQYFYDINNNILMEFDVFGDVTAKYTTSKKIDEIILKNTPVEAQYFHYDGLGSVRDITDSGGIKVGSYSYSPFGMILKESGIAGTNDYTFTGREYDRGSGLYYYRARYYDPEVGRFVSKEDANAVIYRSPRTNLYVYVDNNPVNFVDPWGLKKLKLSFATDDLDVHDWVLSGQPPFAFTVRTLCNKIRLRLTGTGTFALQGRDIIDRTGRCGNCVAELTLHGHGTVGEIHFRRPAYLPRGSALQLIKCQYPWKGLAGLSPAGQQFVRCLRPLLCEDAKITVLMCRVGKGEDGKRLASMLGQLLGAEIWLPRSRVSVITPASGWTIGRPNGTVRTTGWDWC